MGFRVAIIIFESPYKITKFAYDGVIALVHSYRCFGRKHELHRRYVGNAKSLPTVKARTQSSPKPGAQKKKRILRIIAGTLRQSTTYAVGHFLLFICKKYALYNTIPT